jgi:chorismate lyase/3-hydroxybenzoate synthase
MNREPMLLSAVAGARLFLQQKFVFGGATMSGVATQAIPQERLVGGICHGSAPLLAAQRALREAHDGALQYVQTPVLGGDANSRESCLLRLLYSDRPVHTGSAAGIRYRTDGVFVFGCVEASRPGGDCAGMADCAGSVYETIFRFLEGFDPTRRFRLWRVWNYMGDINGADGPLERYRQFNIGRSDAFAKHAARLHSGRPAPDDNAEIPAACGIGTIGAKAFDGASLTVSFLASALDFVQIENPRQISAFHYPPDYGPARPMFSRAILGPVESCDGSPGAHLFVSGTASIVGHRTLHPGDVAEQCRESLRNIAAIVEEANRKLLARKRRGVTLPELEYLVYVRHAEDLAAVQDVMAEVLGAGASAHFVHAEICRSDLLVEIEATRFIDPSDA